MADANSESWIDIAQLGFENWKAKPHNARWFRKIDGTPIQNDLTICIGEAFAAALSAERRAKEEAEAENARLARLVYVPGQWRCAKCNFTLMQANLNANDGTVTARDQPGEKCRNCDSPLWRVTERDAGNEMIDRAAEAFEAKRAAETRLAELARALEEAERFMAYFAGETDGVFVGPGTPKSCLQVIRRARATGL